MIFDKGTKLGDIRIESAEAPIQGAVWYSGDSVDDGLLYTFPRGSLAEFNYLTADALADGIHLSVFRLALQEGENGPAFWVHFGFVNQCSARMRIPLDAVDQNRWLLGREGAWLKPMFVGERVDLEKVDRMSFTILRKSHLPARWCMTPIQAVVEEPATLAEPLLPKGKLIDELGQSTLHDWNTKSRSKKEVTRRMQKQLEEAPRHRWPEDFSKWGGWKEKRFDATGFFRTHLDGDRWWLVDPDGHPFWSAGLDCVRVVGEIAVNCRGLEKALSWIPDKEGDYSETHGAGSRSSINYLMANLIRAFGPDTWYEKWKQIALGELRRLGFNTVANWSDWPIAREAGFPYVRPLGLGYPNTPMIYRDFPDVFHPGFEEDAGRFGRQLEETADDAALIGYFLMNEPSWGFSRESPAEGMLYVTETCETRKELRNFIEKRYPDDVALSHAWGMQTTLSELEKGLWHDQLTDSARRDLQDFSSVMVEKLFKTLSDACRAVDPNHLNLGARYFKVPPSWAVQGMKCFDVFSMNCYKERIPAEEYEKISRMMGQPVMVGEWHFGALDVGLPASGIGHVKNQVDRGKAYRCYLEYAAANPYCVGTHYYTMYDQSALGRFDGENYNIGFIDICGRPYEHMTEGARASHERLYQVASDQREPYDDRPEYLPLLFL